MLWIFQWKLPQLQICEGYKSGEAAEGGPRLWEGCAKLGSDSLSTEAALTHSQGEEVGKCIYLSKLHSLMWTCKYQTFQMWSCTLRMNRSDMRCNRSWRKLPTEIRHSREILREIWFYYKKMLSLKYLLLLRFLAEDHLCWPMSCDTLPFQVLPSAWCGLTKSSKSVQQKDEMWWCLGCSFSTDGRRITLWIDHLHSEAFQWPPVCFLRIFMFLDPNGCTSLLCLVEGKPVSSVCLWA